MSAAQREFDIVLYGATGFAGKLTAQYLAKAGGDARIALAGRSQDKLLAVRPTSELMSLQRWYLGEFARQANGHRPIPWQGPTHLVGHQEVS